MKFLPPNATELEQAIDEAIENRLSNIDLSPVSTLWNPDTPFPPNPMLHNPWHVSICSETTMRVIADKTGLEFVKSIPVSTDTGCAYLLRKPGGKFNIKVVTTQINKMVHLGRLAKHMKYISKNY